MMKVRLLVLLAASLASAIGVAQDVGDNGQNPPSPIPERKNVSPAAAKSTPCCGKIQGPNQKQSDQAQTDQAQTDQASQSVLVRALSTREAGKPRDLAFEQFVDLKMLADAWLQMKPSELLDCALQFRHAEQTLKREHKLISSRDLLDYAARAATAKQDQPTLKRLGRVAEMIKDPQLATIVKLGAESRAADTEQLAISVDDLSPAGFRLVKEVVEGIENATTDGNPAGLDDIQQVVEESDALPAEQRERLIIKIAIARDSLPEDGKNFAAVMEQLAGASRAVSQDTAKYIYDRMLSPDEQTAIKEAGMREAFNRAKRFRRLPPGLATLPDLNPGDPIPPGIQDWYRNDPEARKVQVLVDMNVNGTRVTYVVTPNGDPQGIPLIDYVPGTANYAPPRTKPIQQVPSIVRPGLKTQYDPTRGMVVGVPDSGKLPTTLRPTLPPPGLIRGKPGFIVPSGPSRFHYPIYQGPFGPVIGPPVLLPPTVVVAPLPTTGPPIALPALPPPPLAPTTLVTTPPGPPPTGPPPTGPPPTGPPPTGPPTGPPPTGPPPTGPPTGPPPTGLPKLTCNDVVGTWYENYPFTSATPRNRTVFVFTGGTTPLQGLFHLWVEDQVSPGRWERSPGTEAEGTYVITPGSPLCHIQLVDPGGAPFMGIKITFLGYTKKNTISVIHLQGDRTIKSSPGPQANLIR